MDAAKYCSCGNEAFVDDNYEEAIELYSKAIEKDNTIAEYYTKRATALIKVKRYQEAIKDADDAIRIDATNWKSYLRKGIGLYHIRDYSNAKEAFLRGQEVNGNEESFAMWIDKCTAELGQQSNDNPSDLAQKSNKAVTETDNAAAEVVTVVSASPKIRHDWYQTQTTVTIDILSKKVNPRDFSIDFDANSVQVTFQDQHGNSRTISFNLCHDIIPSQSKAKILTTKIEIRLKKAEGIQWTNLTKSDPDEKATKIRTYPSSNRGTKDWDKIEAEIKQEEKETKLEGDAALNQLFQQIYGDGSDDVKRAMMKSFVESKGTVLSTNWGEVKEKNIDCKPPDGMEFRKYDQ
ncbi:Protein SGT1-like protein A [Trichoplax sp. H2]|nr:Protein SGT1-like protein A [Trichoplax sp. H2]|eukprot:RDD46760.1 Protein SGT1-like protein A [Trichoplax sp. H2]